MRNFWVYLCTILYCVLCTILYCAPYCTVYTNITSIDYHSLSRKSVSQMFSYFLIYFKVFCVTTVAVVLVCFNPLVTRRAFSDKSCSNFQRFFKAAHLEFHFLNFCLIWFFQWYLTLLSFYLIEWCILNFFTLFFEFFSAYSSLPSDLKSLEFFYIFIRFWIF